MIGCLLRLLQGIEQEGVDDLVSGILMGSYHTGGGGGPLVGGAAKHAVGFPWYWTCPIQQHKIVMQPSHHAPMLTDFQCSRCCFHGLYACISLVLQESGDLRVRELCAAGIGASA